MEESINFVVRADSKNWEVHIGDSSRIVIFQFQQKNKI